MTLPGQQIASRGTVVKFLVTVTIGAAMLLPSIACAQAQRRLGKEDQSERSGQFDGGISFRHQIRPLLTKHCVACHGGLEQAGGISFLDQESLVRPADSGRQPIAPGDALRSNLLQRVCADDDDDRMPPAGQGPRLTEPEVELLEQWILQGARWEKHWSLIPPRRQPTPIVSSQHWPRQPVDFFVLARLEAAGLDPAPPADRWQWLRRVSFDLTGLPPSEQQLRDFSADNRPDAYQRVVDRLLASPHYGERWASMWLDLARYADTMGYERDPHRDVWPYRDWVIRALNADMPYDDFTVKQLAGDLLPNATIEDRLATVYHRNVPTNVEAGADDEEFRTAAVIDRVNTTWQAWMGTTFGCAQCHDHPYDPFTQQDYYAFLAFFNSSRDSDADEEFPRLAVPVDQENYLVATAFDWQIHDLRGRLHRDSRQAASIKGQWIAVAFDQLRSTGSTELSFVEQSESGELVASGTITDSSKYTLAGPAPTIEMPITALRIDAFPSQAAVAAKQPDVGFVLSRLALRTTRPEGPAEEVFIAEVVGDDPHGPFDPNDSLRDNSQGWAVYSRINQPRHAVFVLEEPLQLEPEARLELVLKHNRSLDGQGALVLRRARFSVSTEPSWTSLVTDRTRQQLQVDLSELERRRQALSSVLVPVMQEQLPEHRRDSFVFNRGNWLDKGQAVSAATPVCMPPVVGNHASRLELARWIAAPENPLTSRVIVNRIWSQIFGTGLVEHEEDFGASGLLPSHPKLLDDLAVRFVEEHDWSLKRLLRELVLTATYRQDNRFRREETNEDPKNRLLARGPRLRLTAEMIRDQALVLSGEFVNKLFGPPVMPYQPEGLWRSVYSGARWETTTDEDRFRRAIYTYWKRTSPYPGLETFDVPSRDKCTVRRSPTNTPLQALVTLNDPVYVELAQGFAERLASRCDAVGRRAAWQWAYSLATSHRATTDAVDELEALYQDARRQFESDPQVGSELADTAERFAFVVVANALMNLDSTLTR